MLTFQSLPSEIRLHVLSFALSPAEINVCALLRARDGWHSPIKDFNHATTNELARQQHGAPIRWSSPNLNLLIVSRQFFSDTTALLPASASIDVFFCNPWCVREYIKPYSSVEQPDDVAQEAAQHPRAAWSQRNIRRIRYLSPNKSVHWHLMNWRSTEEQAEAYMRRTLANWWGWQVVKVKMRDYVQDEEGKPKLQPSIDVLLENKHMPSQEKVS